MKIECTVEELKELLKEKTPVNKTDANIALLDSDGNPKGNMV